jgi:hypothetical protein
VEILVKEPTDFQLKEYRSMEKIDVLALLVAGDYETPKEELKYMQIDQKEASEFARVLSLLPNFNFRSFLESLTQKLQARKINSTNPQ